MALQEKLSTIDQLQAEINAAGELSAEVKKRINYKFRLDWNYHSNSMEGNTLTKEETRSVMIGNLTVGGKPYKDVAEMRGHDDVVQEILKIGKGEVRLSEKRVKDIHRSIMFEEDPTKRTEIGEWKSKDNYVLNYKGERFDFKPHNEVADEMHSLLNFLNAKIDRLEAGKEDLHPLVAAAKFHLWFVTIHPFYDGNGRTARLLTNLFLIALGFPPIIIRTEEKEKYNRYLADVQAYGGSPDLFDGFMADLLIRSQQMVLDAIAGKSIEDPDDIDKEIDLFKRGFEETPLVDVPRRSNDLVISIYFDCLHLMFERLEVKHKSISDLFSSTRFVGAVNNSHRTGDERREYIDDYLRDLRDKSRIIEKRFTHQGESPREIISLNLTVHHDGFKRSGLNMFKVYHNVTVKFDDFQIVIGDNFRFNRTFLNNQLPSKDELELMVSEMMRGVMEEIKKKSGNGIN